MIFYKSENGILYKDDIINVNYIDNKSVDLIVTSPPYNLSIKYDNHNDNMSYKDYLQWCETWLKKCFYWLKDSGRLCINIPITITMPITKHINHPIKADYIKLMMDIGFKYHNTIIWDKGNVVKTCWGSFANASSPFIRDNIEAIIIMYKSQWKKLHKGKNDISNTDFITWTQNLWKFSGQKKINVDNHPAPYPVELPTRCMKLFSYIGDTILDPFVGSGTSCIAASNINRKWIGIDNSEKYLDFAKRKIKAIESRNIIINKVFGD